MKVQQTTTIQYADKIYNIEQIDEANFGSVTGKKAFNQYLTKALIEAILPTCTPARRFSEKVANIREWERQVRISNKAKEIIAYSFVGIIGIHLSKLVSNDFETLLVSFVFAFYTFWCKASGSGLKSLILMNSITTKVLGDLTYQVIRTSRTSLGL